MINVIDAANDPINNILIAPQNILFPLDLEIAPPTLIKAIPLKIDVNTLAWARSKNKKGIKGIDAPTANAIRLLIAAIQGAPNSLGFNPKCSIAIVCNATFGFEMIFLAIFFASWVENPLSMYIRITLYQPDSGFLDYNHQLYNGALINSLYAYINKIISVK